MGTPLQLTFKVDDKGRIEVQKLDRSLDGLDKGLKKSGKAAKTFDKNMKGVGASSALALKTIGGLGALLAGSAGLRAGIQTIAGFERGMAQVRAVTGATVIEMAALKKEASELGATTEFSGRQAAAGMEFLARAGFNTDEILKATGDTLNLALVGAIDLGTAADITSNILSGFNLRAEETGRVVDVIALTTARANTNVLQMGEALKFVAPIAASLGQEIEGSAAAIGILGNAGIQGTLAGTTLRGVLASLLDPTGDAVKVMKELGLSMQELNPSANSLEDIFRKLRDAGLTTEQAFKLFDRRTAAGAVILAKNVDALKRLNDELDEGEGVTNKMADAIGDNLTGDLRQLRSAAEKAATDLGDKGSLGVMRGIVQASTDIVRGENDVVKTIKAIAEASRLVNAPGKRARNAILGTAFDISGASVQAGVSAALVAGQEIRRAFINGMSGRTGRAVGKDGKTFETNLGGVFSNEDVKELFGGILGIITGAGPIAPEIEVKPTLRFDQQLLSDAIKSQFGAFGSFGRGAEIIRVTPPPDETALITAVQTQLDFLSRENEIRAAIANELRDIQKQTLDPGDIQGRFDLERAAAEDTLGFKVRSLEIDKASLITELDKLKVIEGGFLAGSKGDAQRIANDALKLDVVKDIALIDDQINAALAVRTGTLGVIDIEQAREANELGVKRLDNIRQLNVETLRAAGAEEALRLRLAGELSAAGARGITGDDEASARARQAFDEASINRRFDLREAGLEQIIREADLLEDLGVKGIELNRLIDKRNAAEIELNALGEIRASEINAREIQSLEEIDSIKQRILDKEIATNEERNRAIRGLAGDLERLAGQFGFDTGPAGDLLSTFDTLGSIKGNFETIFPGQKESAKVITDANSDIKASTQDTFGLLPDIAQSGMAGMSGVIGNGFNGIVQSLLGLFGIGGTPGAGAAGGGQIGALAGGAIGTAFGGPIGGIIGTTLGGFLPFRPEATKGGSSTAAVELSPGSVAAIAEVVLRAVDQMPDKLIPVLDMADAVERGLDSRRNERKVRGIANDSGSGGSQSEVA